MSFGRSFFPSVGRVFHVTCLEVLNQMLVAGQICPNTDGDLPTPFGSTDSFFRKRGCVSVFDYRSASATQVDMSIGKCSPYHVPLYNNRLAILFLSTVAQKRVTIYLTYHA